MEKIVSFEMLEPISKSHSVTSKKIIMWLITAFRNFETYVYIKNMAIARNSFCLLTTNN
jgi:hypothetical protein